MLAASNTIRTVIARAGAARALVAALVAGTWGGCATTDARPAPASGASSATGGPAEAYLGRLISGDTAAVLAAFAGEPAIDDPVGGRVRGAAAVARFVEERHQWLASRSARFEAIRTTRTDGRTVFEAVLRLATEGGAIDLPIAVVADRAPGERMTALRVYHSSWPLEGRHHLRAPLLPVDPGVHPTDVVAEYQRALAVGDVDAAVSAFEPDGSFREPSGGPWVHRGREEVRRFMTAILRGGGIGLEHCTLTDDGVAAAIEFNAVRFGRQAIAPQAGLAVYERAPTGRLRAARIYDDVSVETLAPSRPERSAASPRGSEQGDRGR